MVSAPSGWWCDAGLVLSFDDMTRTVYSTDNSIYQVIPEAVAVPATVDEIANLLRTNSQSEAAELAPTARASPTA